MLDFIDSIRKKEMNIKILKHFIAIAQSDTLSDASLEQQITQPALSRSLQILENHVGEDLYIRHHKKGQLTPKGRIVYENARALVAYYDATLQNLQSETTNETIYMGFTQGMGNVLYPKLVQAITKDNKYINLMPMQGTFQEVQKWLHMEKVIMAVNIQEAFTNDLYTNHMYDDTYDLISHKESHLPFGDEIHLRDVVKLNLIIASNKTTKTMQDVCDAHNIRLQFSHQLESPSLLWAMIHNNMGHAIQSSLLQLPSYINKDAFIIRKITPKLVRPIAIGTNKYKSMSANCHYIYQKTQHIMQQITTQPKE